MTQTFPAWLHDQADRDDSIGALAQQVREAGDFPESGGKAIFDGYFETGTAEDREQFERAWSEFEASPEPSPTSETPDGL